jgi:hypothetical protein
MLTDQIGFEANNVNLAMDHLKTTGRRGARRALLEHALLASQRALDELRNEPLVTDTRRYVHQTLERYNYNPLAVLEELRLDQATIRWFVKAECQLLLEYKFNREVVDAIERDMLAAFDAPFADLPDSLSDRFEALGERISASLLLLEREDERADMYRHVAQVLGVLGACGVVAANVATAGVSAGVLGAAIAVSVPAGVEMLSRAIPETDGD